MSRVRGLGFPWAFLKFDFKSPDNGFGHIGTHISMVISE
jgi:hypothetical protein